MTLFVENESIFVVVFHEQRRIYVVVIVN